MACFLCFIVHPQNKINHSVIKDLLDPIKELYEDVRRKALMRLEYEGLHKSEAITTPGARFHNDPAGFAMNRYAYYVCYKCKKVALKPTIFFICMVRGLRINGWPYFRPILEERLAVTQRLDREMTTTRVSSSVELALMFPGLRWVNA